MSKIEKLLEDESNRLLSNNLKNIPNFVKEEMDAINLFLLDILSNKIDINELNENFLTPTLVFIGKIEKLHKSIILNNINEVVLKLDFNSINYVELMDYYDFINNDGLTADLGNTTSLFNNLYESDKFPGINMLHQELYEHEDDTDESNYFLILKSK